MLRRGLLDTARMGRQAEDLERKLRHVVIGQDEAIHQIVRAYQTYLAGLSTVGRPLGNCLFLGAYRLRKNAHRRGDRRVPAKKSSSGNQDRLRRVSTQP